MAQMMSTPGPAMEPPPGPPAGNEAGPDMGETTDIPASLVDDMPAPGDTIPVRVVSVNQDAGTITITKAESEEPEMPEPQGSDAQAAEFDNLQPT